MTQKLKRMTDFLSIKKEDIQKVYPGPISQEDMDSEPAADFHITYRIERWDGDRSYLITETINTAFDPLIYESILLICLANVKARNPAMTLDNYLRCWTQDMAWELADAGVRFDRLIADVKSQLSNEPLSSTTSEKGTTSSNLSRPTKMASPTSLF